MNLTSVSISEANIFEVHVLVLLFYYFLLLFFETGFFCVVLELAF